MGTRQTRSGLVAGLIGLLLMMAVLGILIPRLSGGMDPLIRRAKGDLLAIRSALGAYKAQNGVYPTTHQGLDALLHQPVRGKPPERWNGPYLNGKLLIDPWQRPYDYRSPVVTSREGYVLFSFGPDGIAETEDDIWR